jgi:hypothetical protein
MDVVVRAWHWRVILATAKKLPSLALGLLAFSAPHRGGPERAAPNILNNEKMFTVFIRRSGLQIQPFFLASCASYRQWGWVG